MSVTIHGLKELQAEMAKLEPAPLKKLLQKGTASGGKYLKPKVVAETPRRTGRMRKSVSAATAKKDRPASIVKFRTGRNAWYRHFVIQGTKPHRIRFPDQRAAGIPRSQGNIQHPGAKANNVMGRVQSRHERAAADAAIDTIRKELP
jgi:predicted RNA-binding protein with EMAP domain